MGRNMVADFSLDGLEKRSRYLKITISMGRTELSDCEEYPCLDRSMEKWDEEDFDYRG